LTVSPGQNFEGNNEVLPDTSVAMIEHMQNVDNDAAVYQVSGAVVLRSPFVPAQETGGIGVDAAGDDLPQVVGTTLASGHFLGPVADRYPEVVLGAQAANILEINHVGGHLMVYLGSTWFTVVGILKPALLDSTIDTTVFISLPVAERLFQVQPNPSEIYVRANVNDVTQVSNLLAPTADPQDASGVNVSRPSDALEARAAAKGQFTTLLLGLGAVALLVGAIGIANIMVISVLERRGEIGLRRALGATRRHISTEGAVRGAAVRADRRARLRSRDRRARRRVSGDEGRAPQPNRSVADLAPMGLSFPLTMSGKLNPIPLKQRGGVRVYSSRS
jgi:putative ABC transport system permease protein